MPKIKMTALSVKNLKPVTISKEYFDLGREKGAGALGLRVSPKGKKTWFLAYAVGPHNTKRTTLGSYPAMSLADARNEAINVMSRVNAGVDPQLEKAEYKASETFVDLWEEYIKSPKFSKKAPASRKEEQRKFDKLLKDTIGPLKVQDIRIKHLSPILNKLARTAPVNANRLYALLSFVFKFALNQGLIEVHPMFGMDKPGGKEKPRKRHLTPDEIKVLWPMLDTLSPALCDIFRLILLTAQRPGEVYAMEKKEINLQEKIWTIPYYKTKTKTEHVVPLNKQALTIIESRINFDEKFLFPSKSRSGHISNTSKSRTRLIENMDIPAWTAHDLRRTARTLMSSIGVKVDIAERILNHSRGKIEAVYDLYSFLDEKRAALDKLDREISRIIGCSKKAKVVQLRRVG